MATSMQSNRHEEKPTVGLLLIIGEIIFNEQREAISHDLQRALQQIDSQKYHEINDLFNNLIHENEFHPNSQYRQMANTDNGSLVGFLYLPNFHTVCNVLKDFFNLCSNVCLIFCGQQIDSTGALILSDSTFTSENFRNLFEENPSYLIQDLQLIFPLVSDQWTRLVKNYLAKQLKHVRIDDLSKDIHEENFFGDLFYERLEEIFHRDSIDFDVYSKLIPRDNSGTIAFDEPNLYILYGQHGEASLFGIRGFVLLVNGGFSPNPSYWNLIRGLQNVDACVLTHFDYDTLPGLQTIVHRKLISSSQGDKQSCKPDIGAVFLNRIQRTKLSGVSTTNKSKLSVNLEDNIQRFLDDIKQLNIETWDLQRLANKNLVEPINLFRKIAFGSLDLYVLHPTRSDDEKLIANLQKISIGNEQRSSSMIPLDHWYSSCSLLVWTPSSKTKKNQLVRILYTGVCPQTLIFEALARVQHLPFLHDFQHQTQTTRPKTTETKAKVQVNTRTKQPPPQKPKVSPPMVNRSPSSTIQNKTYKILPRPVDPKPKVPPISKNKPDKARPTSVPKKTPIPTVKPSPRPMNKDKKTDKPFRLPSQPKQTKKPLEKPKPIIIPKKKVDNHQVPKPPIKHQELLTTDQQQHTKVENQEKEKLEPLIDHPEEEEQLLLQTVTNEEHHSEMGVDEHEQSGISQDDNIEEEEEPLGEKTDPEISADELDDINKTSADVDVDADEDEIPPPPRPESISMTNGHTEPLVESNTSSPIEEIKSESIPHDPMIQGFVDGDPNTENPFSEETNDINIDDDMEIIHHDISTFNQHSPPSVEDIHPQGLPIENHLHSSNKSTAKTSMNTTYRLPTRPSKSSSLPDSIYHVDVAFIPNHGHEHYVDSEFFRRIRARYYILNAVQINRHTLQSLIHGKEQWGKCKHQPITLVPTFDGEELRQFFVNNKTHLAELNITILPAAIRCHVQYDGENCPAQLLRFNSSDDN